MKLTKTKLRKIIKEEIELLKEAGSYDRVSSNIFKNDRKAMKKSIEFKIGDITFGKDYKGRSSDNNGIRYYYQQPKKAKNMQSDIGKFYVALGQIVDRNTKEHVMKRLK